jgi:hypothetical protein
MDVMGANNRGFDWYLRRLLAMSPQELSQRVIRDARHRLDDYEWSLAKPLWRRAWQPEPQSLQDRRLLAAPAGFLTPDRAAGLRVHEPPAVEAILAAAEDALAGRFRFFGYPEVTLERPIDFALDPLTGRRFWPPPGCSWVMTGSPCVRATICWAGSAHTLRVVASPGATDSKRVSGRSPSRSASTPCEASRTCQPPIHR